MSHPKLGTLTTISANEVWKHEAHGFTPWLADNLNLLSEALQIDEFELQGTEISTGDFRLDILAEDTMGNPVIIENQFGATNHGHLGQLISYVASTGKPTTTIWVAERFKDDHRAAIDWLNVATGDEFSFFAVEIEALQIGDSDPAPFFNVVAKPNSWTKNTRGSRNSGDGETPQRHHNRRAFWTSFSEYLKANDKSFAIRTPGKENWHSFAIGRSGFGIYVTISPQKKRVSVELQVPRDPTKTAFRQLHNQRDYIDSVVQYPLEWMELKGKLATRIAAFMTNVDAFDEAQWPELQKWLLMMMQRFKAAFTKPVKEIDFEAEDDAQEVESEEI